MATGYTSSIEKGITFKEFALQCARNFGACVEMRDDPMDAEIPDEFKPSDYHVKALKAAEAELKKLQDMTEEDKVKAVEKRNADNIESNKRVIAQKEALLKKYQDMLSQVKRWEPPTPDHVNLKQFMQEQIETSINWDCDSSYGKEEAEPLTPGKWYAEQIEMAAHDITYHTEGYEKECERAKDRSNWVNSLRTSLEEVDNEAV